MIEFVERTPYYAQGPLALVIGCGDMGMGCARALGKRHPLRIADRDTERLGRSVDALRLEGYVAQGIACDIVDSGSPPFARRQRTRFTHMLPSRFSVTKLGRVAIRSERRVTP